MLLNGNTHIVIGVLPPNIDLTQEIRVYTPLESWAGSDTNTRHRGNHSGLYVHGRLGSGVTFEQARAELTATATRFEAEYPDTNSGVGVIVQRLPEWRLRNYRTILWVLQVAVVILWLIACTNVANLMLARAVTRRRQYAISAALGAGPLQTFRQLIVENLLLSLTAAGVGLIIAFGAVQILRTMTPFDIPRLAQAQLNWPVVAFGGVLAILAGLVAGLLPGMRVARQVDVTSVLSDADRRESPPVVVVNEILAPRLWPTQSALGKRLKQGWPESEGDRFPWREIVGVVGNVRQDGLDEEPRSETFIPFGQDVAGFMALVIRTTGDPMRVVEPVRAAIRAAHPDLLAYDVRSMDDVLATAMAPRRFVMWALSVFGLIATLIAAVGIFGILAHSVAQRTHELGVRMALGAGRSQVGGLVVRESVVMATAGILVGAGGSLAGSRLLDSLLLPRTAADPWLWVLVPLFVVTVALVASLVPARRAAHTDPIVALRGV